MGISAAPGLSPAVFKAWKADSVNNPANTPMAQFIQARHTRLCSLLNDVEASQSTTVIPAAVGLGNSIMQGTGATSYGNTWVWVLGGLLQAYYGLGTQTNWAATNYGVGGATIDNVACYLADSGDNVPITPGRIFSLGQYFMVMSIRNSAGNLTVADYTVLVRACIRQIKRCGLDAIFVAENPKITWTSATTYTIYDNATNWTPWLDAAKRVCAEEGATFVDTWRYMMMLETQTPGSIGQYLFTDGTHPSNAGHALIASLVYQAIISPVVSNPAWEDRRADITGKTYLVSKYVFSGVTQTTFSLATNATARQVQRGETSAYAYPMVNGSIMYPNSPIPACGMIVDMLNTPGNTGEIVATYDAISAGTYGPASLASVLEGASHTFWQPGSTTAGSAISGATLTANGPINLVGVVWVGIEAYDCQPTPSYPAPGADWTTATMQPGGVLTVACPAIQDATVGDTLTVNWYGTSFAFSYARGTAFGMFTYATDGGAASAAVDGYLNTAETSAYVQAAKYLTEGWHQTIITVATKNASSSANTVKLCNFTGFQTAPMPKTRVISMNAGETRTIKGSWTQATIEQVISGAPSVFAFTPGQPSATLTLAGAGAALVRLWR